MNCPNCGLKKNVTTGDIINALLRDLGCSVSGATGFCVCPPDIKPPHYIQGNWLTEKRAKDKGDIWVAIWRKHNEPQMADCRRFNYAYAVIGDKVLCKASNDYYDVTEEVA